MAHHPRWARRPTARHGDDLLLRHNVSKGDIISAIDGGCCSLADAEACTAASTGCGGCAALLKNIVDDEMAARGMEVNKSICEHFQFTRQELFHIIKVESIKSFEDLIKHHGSGRGCEISQTDSGLHPRVPLE